MARTSRTPYVLLGLLAQGPQTGYELRQTIEKSTSFFWQESFGQIYPALEQLASDGWARLVGSESQARAGSKTDRSPKQYEITDAGRDALAEWLKTPPFRHVERNELLLKVFFGAQTPIEFTLRHIRASQQEAKAYLETLRDVQTGLTESFGKRGGQPRGKARELALYQLTVDYGILGVKAHLDWCELALSRLEPGKGSVR